MMMVAMEAAVHIVKLGPKKPKKGHLGPKSGIASIEIAVHIVKLGPKSQKQGI